MNVDVLEDKKTTKKIVISLPYKIVNKQKFIQEEVVALDTMVNKWISML